MRCAEVCYPQHWIPWHHPALPKPLLMPQPWAAMSSYFFVQRPPPVTLPPWARRVMRSPTRQVTKGLAGQRHLGQQGGWSPRMGVQGLGPGRTWMARSCPLRRPPQCSDRPSTPSTGKASPGRPSRRESRLRTRHRSCSRALDAPRSLAPWSKGCRNHRSSWTRPLPSKQQCRSQSACSYPLYGRQGAAHQPRECSQALCRGEKCHDD
mmetsp:Transcript_5630/g.11186  ORF Transcript_5630/g.11186 Transcript_5630/m.11186 type:complete len:208 (-) Transcript_5630:765-1388(-)